MILRVYAMWSRSKKILYILLFIYVPQAILSFIFTGIYDNPTTYLSVVSSRVVNFSVCTGSFIHVPLAAHVSDGILRFLLSIVLFILAAVQTVKQSVEMYRAAKQWQPNKYMQRLMADGILYFLVYVFYNITVIFRATPTTKSTSVLFLSTLSYTVVISAMPRFIINIRELYLCDLRDRREGMDSGFGISSQPVSGDNAVMSTLVFTHVNSGQEESQEVEDDACDSGVFELEALGDETRQV
ncbi:hypothetical protein L210DRAFT_3543810 [Boletus edulis BED1]|uniref:Uncharacterized protein n=1 Tax=Boletus edulis BED1 TaxID=1328754 RepID=A0AAD4GDG2_BOLED|nr:hypothetical protein L210DRAFT_3543810 [Boletus edulis BED1]